MTSQTYLSPPLAADYTGLVQSTLAKMRIRGDGPPFIKIGVFVRYPRRRHRRLDGGAAAALD